MSSTTSQAAAALDRGCLGQDERCQPADGVARFEERVAVGEQPWTVLLQELEHDRLVDDVVDGIRLGDRLDEVGRACALSERDQVPPDRVTQSLRSSVPVELRTKGLPDLGSAAGPVRTLEVDDEHLGIDGRLDVDVPERSVVGEDPELETGAPDVVDQVLSQPRFEDQLALLHPITVGERVLESLEEAGASEADGLLRIADRVEREAVGDATEVLVECGLLRRTADHPAQEVEIG